MDIPRRENDVGKQYKIISGIIEAFTIHKDRNN
jgi:hypothetical protein